ncbi:Platelet glycoprotein Ib alpha chain [Rhizoctonia solani]|uniref:Platelet glycoprotein Ib alpha chain n=1 Tax=Rhizoctonia solani TaxID=456999 RepID=A0A0K6GGK5_9AGAM|nr:Platelet glycoprotein Ib alpha chain [Rhizoctonia solani]
MPVPFLSFEGLRGRLSNGTYSLAGNGSLDYGATSSAMEAIDELESTDGSDGEVHFQLQPLNARKEGPIICQSPEPIESTTAPERSKDTDAPAEENAPKSTSHLPNEASATNEAPKEHEPTAPSATRPLPEDQELSHYINHIFPVLHELAGFNLSAQELLTLSQKEATIRAVLMAQTKHHQNRMKFLSSTTGPHHQATQQLCLDLAASTNAYVSALGALGPVFEKATRANDVDTLAVLYTLLHFGGIGELLTRHIARRGNQGAAGNGFLLELSCRWLASSIARYTDLASALRRGSDRQRAVIQAAIHIDIYSSIALCRPPHFLDSYRASFRHGDLPTAVDSNGVQMAVPRLDDLMDIPAKILLALAEMSAMASWKAEHLRHGTLSVMDLSRWAKRIDALLAPPSPESLMGPLSLSPKKPAQLADLSTGDKPPSGTAPKRPSLAGVVQPPPVNAAVSPTVSNPTTPATTALKSEGEPKEDIKASSPIASTQVDQAPAGTLSTSTPAPDNIIDREMADAEVVTQAAPKSPTTERPAGPRTQVHQNRQMTRPPYRRILPPATREVFRCASRVFLHTILSGEHPRVHDIVQAVADTCGALRDLGLSYLPPGSRPTQTDDLRFPVVRGLPFCIFIAGCMAGNMEQGMFLRACLRPVIREIDMQTSELLTAVLRGPGWFSCRSFIAFGQ